MKNSQKVAGLDKLTGPAIMTLCGSWLVELIVGAQLAMGNISVYFTSYYKNHLGYDITNTTFYPLMPIIVIMASVFFPIGNKLIDSFGGRSRPVILLAGVSAVGCTLIWTSLLAE